MGLTFGLIWMVPEKSGQTLQLGWLLVTSLIFFLSVTAFTVPLQSLGYEMTPDYHERTRIMAFGSFWNRIGEFTYQWVFPLTQAAFFATPMTGVRVVGWGVALLFLAIPGIVPGFIGRERFAADNNFRRRFLRDHGRSLLLGSLSCCC